jgi:hypothetical protein
MRSAIGLPPFQRLVPETECAIHPEADAANMVVHYMDFKIP